MQHVLAITLWDNDIERILALEQNLHKAAHNLGMFVRVTIMSEPPLLARMGLLNTLPTFEICGLYWRATPQTDLCVEALETLLKRFDTSTATNGHP